MLGTNDARPCNWRAAHYQAEYSDLIRSFIAISSRPKIMIGIPPPLFPPNAAFLPHAINQEIPKLIPGLAKNVAADGIVDFFAALNGYDPQQLASRHGGN